MYPKSGRIAPRPAACAAPWGAQKRASASGRSADGCTRVWLVRIYNYSTVGTMRSVLVLALYACTAAAFVAPAPRPLPPAPCRPGDCRRTEGVHRQGPGRAPLVLLSLGRSPPGRSPPGFSPHGRSPSGRQRHSAVAAYTYSSDAGAAGGAAITFSSREGALAGVLGVRGSRGTRSSEVSSVARSPSPRLRPQPAPPQYHAGAALVPPPSGHPPTVRHQTRHPPVRACGRREEEPDPLPGGIAALQAAARAVVSVLFVLFNGVVRVATAVLGATLLLNA